MYNREGKGQGSSTKQSVIGSPGSTVNISVLPTAPPVSSTSPPPACNSSDDLSYHAYGYSGSPWMSHYPSPTHNWYYPDPIPPTYPVHDLEFKLCFILGSISKINALVVE